MAKSKRNTPKNGFTSKYLDNLKPESKRYEVGDGSGLRCRIQPSGRKTFWTYANTNGKTIGIQVGIYGVGHGQDIRRPADAITLAQARKDVAAVKRRHADGGPIRVSGDIPQTVREMAEIFYERRIVPHRRVPQAARQILDFDILPTFGKRNPRTITAPEGATMIEAAVTRGAKVHASKILDLSKQLYNFGLTRGWVDQNPFAPLDKKDLGVVANRRTRWLTAEEIKALWLALDRYTRLSSQVRIALKLLLLTAVRTGELVQAKWTDVDFNSALWTIPSQNSKTGESWQVPLTPWARSLFHELREIADDVGSPWVLPGRRDPRRPIDAKAASRALTRMFETTDENGEPLLTIPRVNVHDFRRTVRTHLENLHVDWVVCEKTLNHSLGAVEKTYNRGGMLDQRRTALQTYSDFVYRLVYPQKNVVPFTGGAV